MQGAHANASFLLNLRPLHDLPRLFIVIEKKITQWIVFNCSWRRIFIREKRKWDWKRRWIFNFITTWQWRLSSCHGLVERWQVEKYFDMFVISSLRRWEGLVTALWHEIFLFNIIEVFGIILVNGIGEPCFVSAVVGSVSRRALAHCCDSVWLGIGVIASVDRFVNVFHRLRARKHDGAGSGRRRHQFDFARAPDFIRTRQVCTSIAPLNVECWRNVFLCFFPLLAVDSSVFLGSTLLNMPRKRRWWCGWVDQ